MADLPEPQVLHEFVHVAIMRCPACHEEVFARAEVSVRVTVRPSREDDPKENRPSLIFTAAQHRIERLSIDHACVDTTTEREQKMLQPFTEVMDTFFGGTEAKPEETGGCPPGIDCKPAPGPPALNDPDALIVVLNRKRAQQECWWCDQQATGVAYTDRLPDEPVPSCSLPSHGDRYRPYNAEAIADVRPNPATCHWCTRRATGTVAGTLPTPARRPICNPTRHGAFSTFVPYDQRSDS